MKITDYGPARYRSLFLTPLIGHMGHKQISLRHHRNLDLAVALARLCRRHNHINRRIMPRRNICLDYWLRPPYNTATGNHPGLLGAPFALRMTDRCMAASCFGDVIVGRTFVGVNGCGRLRVALNLRLDSRLLGVLAYCKPDFI